MSSSGSNGSACDLRSVFRNNLSEGKIVSMDVCMNRVEFYGRKDIEARLLESQAEPPHSGENVDRDGPTHGDPALSAGHGSRAPQYESWGLERAGPS